MPDKIKEIETRLTRLEDRLKATFLEVEKRFENLKVEEPAAMVFEHRIQEVEDLLLLLQLEVTKLKETTGGGGFEFGPSHPTTEHAPQEHAPDVDAKLRKIEEEVTSIKPEISERLDEFEQRISAVEKQRIPSGAPAGVSRQLDEIEGRLERLEKERAELPGKGVLEDVRKILEA